jgi:hypothetical protein
MIKQEGRRINLNDVFTTPTIIAYIWEFSDTEHRRKYFNLRMWYQENNLVVAQELYTDVWWLAGRPNAAVVCSVLQLQVTINICYKIGVLRYGIKRRGKHLMIASEGQWRQLTSIKFVPA